MSNRVYLYCTSFSTMPDAPQYEDFFRKSGTEYEAKSCIPLFWLSLFSSADIKILATDGNGFDDDSRPFPYLLCARRDGVERLRLRARMLEAALGPVRYALYQEWILRIEVEPFDNILVRTEELDWMESEGWLEKSLSKALQHLELVEAQGEMRMSNAMNDIAGLWDEEALSERESFELVGRANSKESWPLPLAERASHIEPAAKTPWWNFLARRG